MLSSRMGISFQTAYKQIGDGPVGALWYQWAGMIDRELTEQVDQAIGPQKQESIH